MLDTDGIPGWYNAQDAAELRRLARQASHVDGCAVEWGSYQGRSAVIIEQEMQREVICVDPWLDVPGLITGDETLAAFHRHTHGHAIRPVRARWQDWHHAIRPYGLRVALLHIDADHSYADVYAGIRAAQALITPGGVLCGHDYGWPDGSHAGVTRAVDELLPGRHVAGSVWSVIAA